MNQMLYRRQEAAQLLGISIRQLEGYIRRGEIGARRLGPKCVRIERAELERFVEQIGKRETAGAVSA